jgi:hypothetical protein
MQADVTLHLNALKLNPVKCAECEETIYLVMGGSIDENLKGSMLVDLVGGTAGDVIAAKIHQCDPERLEQVRESRMAGGVR